MGSSKTRGSATVVVSDMQVPRHDHQVVSKLIDFVKDFGPDQLVNVGDDIDSPETSHWSKGKAGEHAGTLQKSLDETFEVHRRFREALGGGRPYHLSRSNHGDRTERYIRQYAPALSALRGMGIGDLIGYDGLGITYHREPFKIAPGWVCAHGDEAGGSSQIAGRTASMKALNWGVSVVCGHTHSAGLIPTSKGYAGRENHRLYGLEVGHLMNQREADYLKGGYANWQSGFGILREHKGKVKPEFVPIDGRTFCVDGVWY